MVPEYVVVAIQHKNVIHISEWWINNNNAVMVSIKATNGTNTRVLWEEKENK